MNQIKQNILVSAILFLSLMTSVAFSYAITPNNQSVVEKPPLTIEVKKEKTKRFSMNKALSLTIPKVND